MNWNLIILILAGIALFLYAVQGFSQEVQKVARDRFKNILRKTTDNRFKSTLLGFIATSIVQSSTATTVVTVGLVGAGVITFSQSLGLILGANIGTTITAQLVSLKLTAIAPIFMIIGFAMTFLGNKMKFLGRPTFFFGLVFFSLSFISDVLSPYRSDPQIIQLLSYSSNIFLGIAIGFVVTNIFQSSSVVTGLVVVLAQNGFLSLPQGIFIALGSNIGTTTTAFIASIKLNIEAKRTAFFHFLFNLVGVLLILPLIVPFLAFVQSIGGNTGQTIANAHMIFNLIMVGIFLIFLKPFQKFIEMIIK